MLCDQVRIFHASGNGMHIAQVITDLLGIFCRCIYHIYHVESDVIKPKSWKWVSCSLGICLLQRTRIMDSVWKSADERCLKVCIPIQCTSEPSYICHLVLVYKLHIAL